VNPISARCLSIIHHLITNYLNDGKNVGSHASWLRKRARKNPPSLLPKSVFIELSIDDSSEEMQSSTSSIKQVPEFERCRYNKNGEVIVNLQLIFDGAFANVKTKTKVNKWLMHIKERLNSGKEGVCISSGDIKWTLSLATPQQIQAVTSHTKTTPLCITRRLVQLWHCFGTT
jgi:hypothetical protein